MWYNIYINTKKGKKKKMKKYNTLDDVMNDWTKQGWEERDLYIALDFFLTANPDWKKTPLNTDEDYEKLMRLASDLLNKMKKVIGTLYAINVPVDVASKMIENHKKEMVEKDAPSMSALLFNEYVQTQRKHKLN